MRIDREIYIFVGSPGCGKGTLSSLCVSELSWIQLSTGNMCRKHIVEGTEIGKTIDFIIKSGKLISDSLITDMVKGELYSTLKDFNTIILDGFPRTENQARMLNELANNLELSLKLVKFVVDYDVVFNRLINRLVCSNKDCQAVYSLAANSTLLPKKDNECDKCFYVLFRREDDSREVIEKRLKEYDKQAEQVTNYFRNKQLPIIDLGVNKPIKEVFIDFKRLIGKDS